ncbi:MAG: iron-sulfur cluster repair di-iron protein [Armatimonadetes bacterium]|nr:iron-sulfur cluster repair di-iron protein [Armatimonadota bacterium]
MGTILKESSVGDLVIENAGRARVLERWKVDYCCGGKRTLEEACRTASADVEKVIPELEACDREARQEDANWGNLSLSDLVDNIVGTHHAYLKEELPRLSGLSAKVYQAHGEHHPELKAVQETYEALRQELEVHMMKEEHILFPLIKQLDSAETLPQFHCGSVSNPIRVMEAEHDNAGSALSRIRDLMKDYVPPADACSTYTVFCQSMAQLEGDLHTHIHKENNILFPRAIERETRLGG